jgi:Zn ribbon nucleic-acid-binding protein
MTVPFHRPCPECGADMELLASDELGAVLVYECVECGYQVKQRVEDVVEPEEDEVTLQPEHEEEEEEEFPEEEEDEDEFDESLWEEEEEEEDLWR